MSIHTPAYALGLHMHHRNMQRLFASGITPLLECREDVSIAGSSSDSARPVTLPAM